MQFTAFQIGVVNSLIIGREPDAQSLHILFECFDIIPNGKNGGGAVFGVMPCHRLQHQGCVAHIARERSGAIQGGGKSDQPQARDPSVAWFHADHAAKCGRLADGTTGIGA